jgi:hypothetical protein
VEAFSRRHARRYIVVDTFVCSGYDSDTFSVMSGSRLRYLIRRTHMGHFLALLSISLPATVYPPIGRRFMVRPRLLTRV